MKKSGHPEYQDILFVDTATGTKFLCGSTLKPEGTDTYEGKEYPAHRISISSASHPFFTGSQQFIDSEGRVDKFMKRYSKVQAAAKKDEKEEDEKEEDKTAKNAKNKKSKKKS